MAQNAELLLKVGLDLSHFRQQLTTIGSQLAGQPLSINVKLDRQKIVSEFRLLDRYVRNKKFYVEINTNLKAEVDRAVRLTELLKNMPRGGGAARTPGVVEAGFSQAQLKKLKQDIKPLYKAAADAGLVAFDETIAKNVEKIAKALSEVGKSSITGLLNGLNSGDAQVRAAAQNLGNALISTIKATLGIASPSKETGKLGEFAGEGFVLGFIKSLVRAERRLANIVTDTAVATIYEGLSMVGDLSVAFAPLERRLKAGALRAVRRAFRDGLKDAVVPSLKGGLLGLLGGGATGGLIGGIQGAAGTISGGLTTLGAGGQLGIMRQLGRLTIGDTSGLTAFAQELAAQAMHHAFSTGTLGAIVGAAAVGGVTGSAGFIRGTIKSTVRQLTEAIINKIAADIDSILAMEDIGGNVGQSLKRFFNVLEQRLNERLAAMAIAFPPMMKALPPAYRGLPPAPGPAGLLPPAYRGLPGAAPMQALAAAQSPAGLLPSISQSTVQGFSAAAGLQAIFAAGGPTFPEGPSGKLALTAEALKQRIDAILTEYFKVAEVTVREIFDPQDLKKALRVFSFLPQVLREAEAAAKKARIEAKVAQLVDALEQAIDAANARLRMRPVQVAVAAPQMLPGTTFGAQKRLIGDILDPSLKAILRDAANAFVDAVRQQMNSAVRSVVVRDLGTAMRPALGAGRIAGLLPPSVGRMPSPYAMGGAGGGVETRVEMFARREREARARSEARAAAVMGGGGGGGGILPPAPRIGGGGGGGRRGGGSGGLFGGLPNISLPGSEAIRELGQEFAFATKQVLLFGQAYKLLAFIQDFPAQVGQAVGQLQSFRNTLNAISPTAAEAAKSSKFILSIVDKYNIPLQSARDGFTKLYASMAPAGFGGDEIRGLFTGISQAAATFGMSADKVDRVNYAFAQMASKGQVMSEELKGQLGDVLPGAMAIFAEAAGFKGAKAIAQFSKALEDGAYKGEAMKALLTNVGIIMRQEFGPGAEGAARTFQGIVNRMQNSLKFLYESFEPVAVGFLNSVVLPLTNGIKTVTDGFNAFFTGAQAKTAGGTALAQQLNQLKPSLEGIGRNLQQLLPSFQFFGAVLLNVSKVLVMIAGNPIVGFLLKVYTNVLLVNAVFSLLGGRVLIGLIASINAAIARFIALNVQVGLLQRTSVAASSSLAGTQLQMALLTRNATTATGPIAMLVTALKSIAAIGVITVAINLIVTGLSNAIKANQEIAKLREQRLAGGQAAIYGGSAPLASKQAASKTLQAIQAERRRGVPLATRVLGSLAGLIGQQTPADLMYRARLLQERELAARATLGLRTRPETAIANLPISLQSALKGDSKAGKKGAADKAANDAKRLAEEIARQAAAASDALFTEQQRLLVLQQTNPTAKAIVEYTNQELAIQRELNKGLKEAKSEKEKADLREVARLKSSSNLLDLQNSLNDAGKEGLQRLEDAIKTQQEELFVNGEIEKLLREKVSPERAKQIADVRLLVNKQLESLDLSIGQAEAAAEEAKARGASVTAIENTIAALKQRRSEIVGKGTQLEAGIPMKGGPKTARDYLMESADEARKNLEQLTNQGYQLAQAANSIGDAFGNAFKGLITGSMTAQEALAGFFSSIADHFADMVAKMIAEWLKAQLIQGFMNFISAIIPGAGALGSAATGLSGAGALASGGIKGFSGGSMAGLPTSYGASTSGLGSITAGGMGGFGTWTGLRFANGGIVSGPTLGLVGEGRYNEAIVPLPDGRSIPVELGGGMGGINVVVNVDAKGSEAAGNEGQAKALGSAISAAVQSEIIKQKRPGGLLAR